MVPVELNTVPCAVAAGGVTFTVMIMVCGGLAPPLVEPPRLGVVTWMSPPNAVLKAPGQFTLIPPVGVKVQVKTPPLLMVRAMLLSCRPAGMLLVKTRFGAGTCVVLLRV